MRNHAPLGWAGLALSLLVILGGAPQAHAQSRSGSDGWLGVLSQSLTPELQDGLDYRGEGVLVNRVVEDSPAYRAGIEKGDVIVSVNQRSVNSPDDLARLIRAQGAGEEVSIRIVRDGERRMLTARLSSRPGEEGTPDEGNRDEENYRDLKDLDRLKDIPDVPGVPDADEIRRMVRDSKTKEFHMLTPGRGRLGVQIEDGDRGAEVVNVVEGSAAERAGIQEGDVITRVDGERVADAADLIESLRGKQGTVEIELKRRGTTRTVEAELEASAPRARSLRIRDPQGFDWHQQFGETPRVRMLDDGKSNEELRRELRELRRELAELRRELAEMKRNR